MSQELIMNVTPGETRIARLENGVLSELSIERNAELQVAGNIYLGRINRVLPGMQAAFVDIGLEKAAFLYVADIVPGLFEGVDDEIEEFRAEELDSDEDDADDDIDEDNDDDDDDNEEEEDEEEEQGESASEDNSRNNRSHRSRRSSRHRRHRSQRNNADNAERSDNQNDQEKTEQAAQSASNDSPQAEQAPNQDADSNANESDQFNASAEENNDNTQEALADQDKQDDNRQDKNNNDRQNQNGRNGRGRNRDRDRGRNDRSRSANSRRNNGRSTSTPRAQGKGRGRPNRARRAPLPKIEDVVKEGQTIVVQIAKEPIRTKGARVTSHVSLPGRYLVYMPTVNHVGVSRRIGSYEERSRLKKILAKYKPASGGFIARTNCVGAPEEKIHEDMENLVKIWQGIYEKQEKSKPPKELYTDLDMVLRVVRDNFSQEIDRLVIDSKEHYNQIKAFVEENMPDLAERVEFYDRDTPIFDVYGIETEINRALGKKIWLKSGGYLIVDSSEALTAVDVNTGRFVGKKDFEETILTTNLEAVEEISYQLKLRSIGGIIIIDFIDMNKYSHRMKVYHALKDALRKDRVKTTISKISDLGLIEMTRKRTRESLTQMLSSTCSQCHGTGYVKTPITVAFETFREIKRVYGSINTRSLLVKANPKVAKVLFNEGRDRLEQVEKSIGKRIVIEADDKLLVDQFEIRGRSL
ncbi:MAG: Rne/Rng family ribonuclease [Deltaproteobacteria bacterium]|nr:Rne/Rng family ribonuclease [Deltaproteobacteria bacterium]